MFFQKMTSSSCAWRCFALILLGFLLKDVESLRLLEMNVPEKVREGDDVPLRCIYDLEGDDYNNLYSLKWYRNGVEFYRYMPNANPTTTYFYVPHVPLDIARSVKGTVVLRNVDVLSSGTYGCEISAGPPDFYSVFGERDVEVEDI